jgi:ABC-type transporter Mla subunit MlaD
LLGATVANLTNITDILISVGGANAHIQRVLNQVDTKADEIQKVSNHVQQLAKQIESDERNVSAVRDELRKAVRPMLYSFLYTLVHSGAPHAKYTKQIEEMIAFAYPDPREREVAMNDVIGQIAQQSAPTKPAPP